MQFPILFADADFCCGMDTPEKAKNVSGWLPGRAQNRGAFHFPKQNMQKKKKNKLPNQNRLIDQINTTR